MVLSSDILRPMISIFNAYPLVRNPDSSNFVSHRYRTHPGYDCLRDFLLYDRRESRLSPMFSSRALVQTTDGWFQVPSCDGLTFIEDGGRSAAGGSVPWGTNRERYQSHGDEACTSLKGWE